MKHFYLFFLVLFGFYASAQKVQTTVQSATVFLKNETVVFNAADFKMPEVEKLNAVSGRFVLLAALPVMPSDGLKTICANNGIVFVEYLKQRTYIVSVPVEKLDLLMLLNPLAVTEVKPEWKIDPKIASENAVPEYSISGGKIGIKVRIYDGFSPYFMLDFLRKNKVGFSYFPSFKTIEIPVENGVLYSMISVIAARPEVSFIEPLQPPLQADNLPGVNNHRANYLSAPLGIGKGLSGNGIIIGEWDGAGIGTHVDFTDRLVNMQPFVSGAGGEHATHVAGTMLGAGNINPYARGMAPGATFYAWDFGGYIPYEMDSSVRTNGILMTQNSYAYNPAFDLCPTRGNYDANSSDLDLLVMMYPNLVHVFANGNSRSNNCVSGGYRTVHSGYQSAKNVITVGAVQFNDVNSTFSSYGPTLDGRLKPDVTAVGVNVFSTTSNNTYTGGYNGTSMACPGTSGTLALLYEQFKKVYGFSPYAHTLKAVLCNTSEDLGRPGPDFQFGFGRINGRRASHIIDSGYFWVDSVGQSAFWTDTLDIASGLLELKIMLVWDDRRAAPNARPALVNDLDLEIDSAGVTIRPWVVESVCPSCNATRKTDTLNNSEQVTIKNPVSGKYVIKVIGKEVPFDKVPFTVTYERIKKGITVSYPNGGESMESPSNTAKQQYIAWDAYGALGKFKLEYSTNNGASWITIIDSVSVASRSYTWNNAPASLVTGQALIRVSDKASLTDKSDSVFNIFGVPAQPNAKFCNNQIHLNWARLKDASLYEVYMLSGAEMTLMGTTADTFFTIKNLVNGMDYWVALRAYHKDGAYGPRSISKKFTLMPTEFPPLVSLHPDSFAVCIGESIVLYTQKSGTNPIVSQWQYSTDSAQTWNNLIGENQDSLVLSPVTFANHGLFYRNTFLNVCQNIVTTLPASITTDTAIQFLTIPTDTLVCMGDSVVFKGIAASVTPVSYQWQQNTGSGWNNIASATDTILTIGRIAHNYNGLEYRITASNLCESNKPSPSAILFVRAPLQVFAGNDSLLCRGNGIMLHAIASGGDTSGYVFNWNVPITQNPLFVIPTKDSVYKVSLVDGCSDTIVYDSLLLRVRDALSVIVGNDTTICQGTEVSALAKGAGGVTDDYVFKWQYNSVVNSFANPLLHEYKFTPNSDVLVYVELTDGCTVIPVIDSMYVFEMPDLALFTVQPDTICVGQTAELKVIPQGGLPSQYAFTWDNNPLATDSIQSVSPLVTTLYSVVLQDNCSVIPDTAYITLPVREPLSVTVSNDTTVCTGSSALVYASGSGGLSFLGNAFYSWDNGLGNGSQKNVSPNTQTTYSVIYDDGCSTPVTASVTVSLFALPVADFIVDPNPACANRNLLFSSTTPDIVNYEWIVDGDIKGNNATLPMVFSTPGKHNVGLSVTDINGCIDDTLRVDAVEVLALPVPIIQYVPKQPDVSNTLVTFSHASHQATSVEWVFNNSVFSNLPTDTFSFPTDTGSYPVKLTVFNSAGCDSSLVIWVKVLPHFNFYVPDAFSPDADGINELFFPKGRGYSSYEMSIVNRWGQLVFKGKDQPWNGKAMNTGSDLPTGVYICQIAVTDWVGVVHYFNVPIHLLR